MTEWQQAETFRIISGDVRWGSLGQPGKDPVVLLYGTPFSSYVWRAGARSLARRHQVFVWDMPGYGVSEMPLPIAGAGHLVQEDAPIELTAALIAFLQNLGQGPATR
ncbi:MULTISPECIES: alpha/beta fold hydrolase [unclassified Streptomyces]|uniref:alpha/beta fold hydrolase n=1 Tax=unclassified Streptomyces TaxID=2593676 RepID=UPI0037F30E76